MIGNDPTPMAFERGPSIDSGLGNNLSSSLEESDLASFETQLWTHSAEKDPSQGELNPISRQFATDDLSGHRSGRSVNSTRPKNAENHYWCTVCVEPNSYKDSGNWKKHEKEHETIFVCELNDAAESGKEGQSHASKAFTSKRRDVMVNHLNKSHGIVEAHRGRNLADQWRHTVKKQAWSCGFCVSLFLTFQDRLKHVDVEHFRRHQSIHEWDLNKVILGLLQQPKMEKAWKTRTASLPSWVHPGNIAWGKAIAKELRATLEIGPSDDHHASTLADAAYFASEPNEGSWLRDATNHANRHSDVTAQASFLSSPDHYQAIPALTSDSGLYHRSSSATRGSTAHLVSNDPSFIGAPTTTFGLDNTVEPAISSFDDNLSIDYDALLFNPSQSWASASEPGTFFNSNEQSNSYAGGGADRLTLN